MICCRGTAEEALTVMQGMMARLRLTVNETKTRLCRGPDEPFDFLGYTIGRCDEPQSGWASLGVRPSRRKIQGLNLKISEQTDRRWVWLDAEEMVGRLDRLLGGWGNYFRLGTVSAAYRKVTQHAGRRLRQWLVKKYGVQGSKW